MHCTRGVFITGNVPFRSEYYSSDFKLQVLCIGKTGQIRIEQMNMRVYVSIQVCKYENTMDQGQRTMKHTRIHFAIVL